MAQELTSTDWILHQSHRYPLLTAEQEIHYARQVIKWLPLRDKEEPNKKERLLIKEGRQAYEQLYLCNIRLVVHIAGRYHAVRGCLTMDDLVQEGLVGLDAAICKFDPTLGYKFSTYGYWWIRQSITRYLTRYSRVIHLPCGAADHMRKAKEYMRQYNLKHGKMPPLSEVADHCKIQVETLRGYLSHSAGIASMDQCVPGHDDITYTDVVADKQQSEKPSEDIEGIKTLVAIAIEELSDVQRWIIQERYYCDSKNPATYNQLGKQIGLSRESVRIMHDDALAKLRIRLGGLTGQECIQALQSVA